MQVDQSRSQDAPPPFSSSADSETSLLINEAPVYSGPIILKKGLKFLHRIEFDYDSAPVYYDGRRPDVLEKKISNLTYADRIASLNQELCSNGHIGEFLSACWMYYVAAAVSLFIVIAVGTYINPSFYGGMAIPLVIIGSLPYDAEYINICKDHINIWNAENESLGINIVYMADPRRPRNGHPLINVPIVVLEKEDGEEAALPRYSQ